MCVPLSSGVQIINGWLGWGYEKEERRGREWWRKWYWQEPLPLLSSCLLLSPSVTHSNTHTQVHCLWDRLVRSHTHRLPGEYFSYIDADWEKHLKLFSAECCDVCVAPGWIFLLPSLPNLTLSFPPCVFTPSVKHHAHVGVCPQQRNDITGCLKLCFHFSWQRPPVGYFQICTGTLNLFRHPPSENTNVQKSWTGHEADFNQPAPQYKVSVMPDWAHV